MMDAGQRKEVEVFRNFSKETQLECAYTMNTEELLSVVEVKNKEVEEQLKLIKEILK